MVSKPIKSAYLCNRCVYGKSRTCVKYHHCYGCMSDDDIGCRCIQIMPNTPCPYFEEEKDNAAECQDLSVAGKRAGLKHESNGDDETTRSGLFMEAIRIIKEMRGATNGVYPRFAVWENVFGAFSSNGGEDFRIVLEEFAKIVEPSASMPAPEKGRWAYADCYVGDGWSVAYRTFDAQYWGVPQRRRRIYLVADFGGECAWKILFERDGVRGYFETGRTPWKGAAADDESGAGVCDCAGNQIAFHLLQYPVFSNDVVPCIGCGSSAHGQASVGVAMCAGFKAGNGAKANGIGWQEQCAPTLGAAPSGTNQVPAVCTKVFDARGNGDGDIVSTLTGDHENRITDYTSVNTIDRHCVAFAVQSIGDYKQSDVSSCLKERDYKGDADLVVECAGVDCRNMNETVELYPTLQAKPNGGQSLNFSGAVRVGYTVRRLTPTECARLQGFPDAWGHPDHKEDFTDEEYRFWLNVRNTHAAINGKPQKGYTKAQMLTWYNKLHTDSAEYKMYGNGIALPCALYVMQGIEEALIHDGMEIDNRIRK